MSAQLKIVSRMEGADVAVLALAGEVDVANATQVREAGLKLISDGVKRLVIDLSETEYMDTSGLGTLVGLQKRIKESGGEILLAALQPRVMRPFEITGLTSVFKLYDDVGSAVKEARS